MFGEVEVMRLSLVPRTTEFYDLFTAAGEKLWPRRARPRSASGRSQSGSDREDIYELAKAIDDVVDYIENASDLLGLYQVGRAMDQSVELSRILVAAVENLAKAIAELRGLRNAERYLVEVKRLEDDGDRILREAIASLFQDRDVDPMTVIRWKDILEALEDAVGAAETAADVVGNIVVKNL